MDIPPGFLKMILSDLVAQGLLISTAGPNGGYRLARPPEDLTLLDNVESAERHHSPDKCILRGGPCDWYGACPIHHFWSLAQKAFADSLDATNLAQLAHVDPAIEEGTHTPINPNHANQPTRRGIRT
jgi:Rrf2 family protein